MSRKCGGISKKIKKVYLMIQNRLKKCKQII